jgi:hypothetical protein
MSEVLGVGVSRLDNIENNSDGFFQKVVQVKRKGNTWQAPLTDHILDARGRAKRNNEWAKAHMIVNEDTGEILTDKEGKPLSLMDSSRSRYNPQRARNNARHVVQRLQKMRDMPFDLEHRPKFVTFTFADVVESWQADRAMQKCVDAIRHWAKRRGLTLAYFWTSEVQMKNGRGALHYHILLFGLPYLSKKVVRSWWPFGFVDIRAVDDIGRAFKYLAKYLWKWGKIWDTFDAVEAPDDVSNLPEWWFLFNVFGKRRFGFSKMFQLPIEKRIPSWLRENLEEMEMLDICVKASRAVGGGWHLEFNDEVHNEQYAKDIASPYKIVEVAA